MSTAWVFERERGSAFALHLVGWIARCFGRGCSRAVLYPITLYFFLTARRARAASYDYLCRVIRREPSPAERFRHFYWFASTILDRVYFLTGGVAGFDVRVTDPDGLWQRIRARQGCVLLGAHVGSFEMLRTLAVDEHQVRLKVLMRTEQNAVVTRFLAALNPSIADTVVELRGLDDMLRLRDHVEQGGLVALLADRVLPGEPWVECEFLGSEARFPLAPFRLAAALRVPIYLFFGLYQGGRRYDACFEVLEVDRNLPAAERSRTIRHLAQQFAGRLAWHVRRAPFNWFNFFPFWGR